ncbi:hypothetical protein D3C78_1533360 [compost metagenome]
MNLSREAPGFSASCNRKLKAPAKISDSTLTISVPSNATANQRARRPSISRCSCGVSMLTSSNTSNPASRLGSNRSGRTSSSPPKMMTQLMTSKT